MTDTHSNCCSTTPPKQGVCPVNGKSYHQVAMTTVMHHVSKPWQRQLVEQTYYYCDDPGCQVVYFGEDETLLTVADVRSIVGHKSTQSDRPVCYCFDVTQQDLEMHTESCRHFVINKTREATCHCEILNPAGRCCLRDFPK